jgi:hypothetical protein
MTSKRLEPASIVLAATIFLSAFLLFQIQPLISKVILPWFGGTSAVWTTSLLFFQSVLFAGYLYAHLVASRLTPRVQAGVHLAMLTLAVATLSILPGAELKPTGGEVPVLRILQVLGVTVGVPYFVLSTTGPLLQWWFSLLYPGRSPYRLYALSNAGSLLALASYPFVIEPSLAVGSQGRMWSIGFWIFAGLCAVCAGRVLRGSERVAETNVQPEMASEPAPSFWRYLGWFFLAMTASALLLAMTNHVGQDAVVPFLWVLPLVLYLLSFILCFDSDRWYWPRVYSVLTALLVLACCAVNIEWSRSYLPLQAAIYFSALFVICMLCHGELARRKPGPRHLTGFYLTLSAGGAAGGLLVAVVAPYVFSDYWEFYGGLAVSMLLAIEVFFDRAGWLNHDRNPPLLAKAGAIALLSLVGVVIVAAVIEQREAIATERNFYGVLHVEHKTRPPNYEGGPPGRPAINLIHGRISHGLQYVDEAERGIPTTYYTETSGVGRSVAALREQRPTLRIGAIGLGVGTVAAYGKKGDFIRFYEINENVERVARQYFTFLESSPATIDVAIGDARLTLEREEPQRYDLLIVDAFSGDAIPTHLLTKEAMQVFQRHVVKDGIIAFHISNIHFNLRPVVDALADDAHLSHVEIYDKPEKRPEQFVSHWVLVSATPEVLERPVIANATSPDEPERILWTDSFSNLWGVLQKGDTGSFKDLFRKFLPD